MGVRKQLAKDVLIYGIGKGLKKFIGIFLLPFYTRALTVEEFGILSTLGTLTMFLSAIFRFGLDSASGFYFFRAEGEEKGRLLYTLMIIRVFLFLPSLLLALFSVQISNILFGTEKFGWVVFISIIADPVNHLMNEQSHVFRYYRLPWKYNIIVIIKSLSNVTLGILLVVLLQYGIIGAQVAGFLSTVIVVIISFLLFTRNMYVFNFSWVWAKKMFKFGFPLIWASMAYWVFGSSDRFFLLKYSNLTEIGFYSIGATFSQPIELLNMAVQMSFGVLFYKNFFGDEDPDKKNARKLATETVNMYLAITVSFAMFISIFGLDLINLIATKKFGNGVIAIPFLAFSSICAQLFQIMGPGIEFAEKTYHYTWITVLAAVINIIFNFIFIPPFGFIGAALSTLLSFFLYWIIKFAISQHFFYINYNINRILIALFITFLIALSVPSIEIEVHKELNLLTKTFIFLFGIAILFLIKIANIKDVYNVLLSKIIMRSKND